MSVLSINYEAHTLTLQRACQCKSVCFIVFMRILVFYALSSFIGEGVRTLWPVDYLKT